MKSLKNIEAAVKKFNVNPTSELKSKVLDDAMRIQRSRTRQNTSDAHTWSIIMKGKSTQFAAAALIIVAVVIAINGLTVTPAWAIEQTIEALRDVKGIYFAGTANYQGRPAESFEIWTRPSRTDASVSGDFRLLEGTGHISVASEEMNRTFVCTKNGDRDIVYVTEGINRHCTPFPTADLFSFIREHAASWKEEYGQDPQTGRDSVFVTCKGLPINTAPYWRLQFDLETKFPVRAGVWFSSDYSGDPHFDFTTFIYNPEMADDLFTFEIPQDAQVIDCTHIRRMLDEIVGSGTNVDDRDTQGACKRVAQEYWQAVITRDVAKLKQLRPLTPDSEWNRILKIYETCKPVNFTHTEMTHLNDPGAFAEVTCTLMLEDGKTANSTLNIDVRQSDRGTLGVVTGVLGPELQIRD